MSQKTFAIALMNPPYESENLTTAFRILAAMAQRGHKINVFTYEGASALAFAKQAPHPNPSSPPWTHRVPASHLRKSERKPREHLC